MADWYGQGYDNIDDAAAAALMALSYQPHADLQEYIGVLVQDPITGKIYRSGFQTQGSNNTSSWTGYPGGKIIGIAHTHPTEHKGNRYPSTNFSVTDVNQARKIGEPSYVTTPSRAGPNADLKYTPETKDVASKPVPGQEFLAQFPIEEMLQQMARTNPMTAAYLQQKKAGGDLSPIAAAARVTEMLKMPQFDISAATAR